MQSWETTTDSEWADKQRQIWLTFARGGPMAEVIGKLLDVAPPKPYEELLLEQARKAKAEEERKVPAPKKTGLETRQVPTVPEMGLPVTKTWAPATVPPRAPVPGQAEPFNPLRAAVGGLTYLGIAAPRPSWLPKQAPWIEYRPEELTRAEEAASAVVAAGPTAIGFGAGAEAELPIGTTLGALKARIPQPTRFAEEAFAPGVTEAMRGAPAAEGFRPKPPETVEELKAQLGETLRGAPKREEVAPPLTPAAGEGAGAGRVSGAGGVEPPTGARPPSAGGEMPEDPAVKLTQLIKAAKKTRPEAEALKHEARVQQAAQLRGVWAAGEGEVGAIKALGTLKGELPKARFEPPRPEFTQTDVDGLYNRIAEHTFLVRGQPSAFKPVNVQSGLTKLLRGQLPTGGEIQGLEEVFGKEFADAVRSRLPLGNRLWREFWEVIGAMRGVQASFDMSFGLRQGIVATPRHPTAAAHMWKEGARQFAPFIGEARAAERLAYWEGERLAGNVPQNLFLAEWGPGAAFTQREEVFISRFLDYIPFVRMSGRSFAGMGNELRGRISQGVVNGWRREGTEVTEKMMDDLGRLANYVSGRGPIPDNLGQVLSGLFYAPRFVTRWPAFLKLILDPSTSPKVRWLAAQELVAFVGTGLTILSAVKLSGLADVEADPRSSDFGKIRLGKLRYDFWGGAQQHARYVAQLISGQRKTIGTGEIVSASRQAVLGRFVQSKLSPQAGLGLDIWRGETFMGEDVEVTPGSLKTQAWNRAAPMFIQDVVDAVKIQGAAAGVGTPLSFFGAGVQAMWTPGQQVNALTQKYDPQGRSVQEMSAVEFKRLAAEHPDLAAARDEQVKAAAAWGSEWALGKQEQTAEDVAFQSQFLGRWRDPQGMTRSDFTDALTDYLQSRAQRNEVRFTSMDSDPRTDLERRLDDYYGAKLPAVATPAEREAFYSHQQEMLAADPELAQAVKDNQRLIFPDRTMQAVAGQIWDAKQIRKQYYAIPAFIGLSAQEGDQVTRIIREADALVQMGQYPARRLAIMALASKYPQKVLLYALQGDRLRNPERRMFRMQHADELSWFEELPVDTLAMAGVG